MHHTRISLTGSRTSLLPLLPLLAVIFGCEPGARPKPADGAGARPASHIVSDANPSTSIASDSNTTHDDADGSTLAAPVNALDVHALDVPAVRSLRDLDHAMFLDNPRGANSRLATCKDAPITSLIDFRLPGDSDAQQIAYALSRDFAVSTGVAQAHTMDGGYRGPIQIVPHVPHGATRKHLLWVLNAFKHIGEQLHALRTHANQPGPFPGYRARGIDVQFFESVGRTTPSAVALDWRLGYNVRGSLLHDETGVRETLVHEIFHLNDQAHGGFSEKHLTHIFEQIRHKCGAQTHCLAGYAPGDTIVRGGTFYAFQPGNDAREYAAELAVRYFREQEAALAHHAHAKPLFKCGPAENREAWALLVHEFFDDIDATQSSASCKSTPL
jgi:hypothetical protein